MSSVRRPKRSYLRLGIFLAEQPASVDRLEMSQREIEAVIEDSLPDRARYPVWWRNDAHRDQAKAWLLAGWRVASMDPRTHRVVFVRNGQQSEGSPADD